MIPTVDLAKTTRREVAAILTECCTDVGFLYLTGHSIPRSLLDDVLAQSKCLFDLPLHRKTALSDPVLTRGFTRLGEETLDPANQTKGDTKEGYYIGDDISGESADAAKLRGPNVWPDPADLPEFRSVMERYQEEADRVCRELVRCFALAVSDDEFLFDRHFDPASTFLRLLHYSAEPSDVDAGVYGCGAHSDYGMITLLLTDDNPGLQVLKGGEWVDVPPKEGAFVVNIGDMFERWTNGKFRSGKHRVVTPREGTRERYSAPFFFDPDFDAVVEVLESCCDEGSPAKFPPISSGQYLLDKYRATHADFDEHAEGRREVEE